MIKITEMLLINHNRPMKKLKSLKGVVIHWTANEGRGADAIANRNYFNTTERACSAHYIVDDRKIIQCIPEEEVAYHVGASKYSYIGQSIREGVFSPNFFLIGIEMCVNADGIWNTTYKNTVQLAASLLKKYKFTTANLYRHFDITVKDCPRMLLQESVWDKFKKDVDKEMLIIEPIHTATPVSQFKAILKLDSKGIYVSQMQHRLNELGFKCLADGIYGYKTMTAVQNFQAKNSLKPDGVVDIKTWNKLFQ